LVSDLRASSLVAARRRALVLKARRATMEAIATVGGGVVDGEAGLLSGGAVFGAWIGCALCLLGSHTIDFVKAGASMLGI
jgi:hypothetical protein